MSEFTVSLVSAGIAVLLSTSPLYADVTAENAADAAAGSPDGLQEIVVTAQRRSESLEKTPVAVSVVGSAALAAQNIVSESDLHTEVAGLTVRASLSSNELNYSLRGQTVDAFSGSTPAVLPYFNEVQVGGGSGGASAFYDLQSIQVLKGPQGTLFGKNSTGGAVLYTTAQPTDTFGGYFSASTGNYGLAQFEGALNVPINDMFQGRIAAFYESHVGYQTNFYTDSHQGNVDRDGVRGSLTAKFSDSVKNELVIDYYHAAGSSLGLVIANVAPQFSNNAPVPANLLYTPFLDTAIGFPGAFAAYTAGNPKIPPGGIYNFTAFQNKQGPFRIYDSNEDAHLANNFILSNITTFDLRGDLQFKNIFGYLHTGDRDGDDADGSPYQVDNTPTGQLYGINYTTTQFSEEPQLIGKAFDGDLNYVTGLYYNDNKTLDLLGSYFAGLEPLAPPTAQNNDTDNRDKTYAGYAQGTYDLSKMTWQGFSATAGARYTDEKLSMAQLPGSVYYDYNGEGSATVEHTFKKVSWQVGVQEQLNSDLLLYVVSRRSFRSGGFSTESPPINAFGSNGGAGFDAETATDVELGAKFQGSVVGMPTRLNVALYTETVDKVQRTIYAVLNGAPAALTANVPQAKVQGIEVDGLINPVSWLTFGTNFAYTDARFSKNQGSVPGPTPASPPLTIAFGPYADTPAWSGTLYSQVTLPVSADLSITARGEIYDQTKLYFTSTFNTLTPGAVIPGYAVTNFLLSLADRRAGWTVTANVKNAFNRVYYAGGGGFTNVFDVNAVIPGDPRTFVVTARYNF